MWIWYELRQKAGKVNDWLMKFLWDAWKEVAWDAASLVTDVTTWLWEWVVWTADFLWDVASETADFLGNTKKFSEGEWFLDKFAKENSKNSQDLRDAVRENLWWRAVNSDIGKWISDTIVWCSQIASWLIWPWALVKAWSILWKAAKFIPYIDKLDDAKQLRIVNEIVQLKKSWNLTKESLQAISDKYNPRTISSLRDNFGTYNLSNEWMDLSLFWKETIDDLLKYRSKKDLLRLLKTRLDDVSSRIPTWMDEFWHPLADFRVYSNEFKDMENIHRLMNIVKSSKWNWLWNLPKWIEEVIESITPAVEKSLKETSPKIYKMLNSPELLANWVKQNPKKATALFWSLSVMNTGVNKYQEAMDDWTWTESMIPPQNVWSNEKTIDDIENSITDTDIDKVTNWPIKSSQDTPGYLKWPSLENKDVKGWDTVTPDNKEGTDPQLSKYKEGTIWANVEWQMDEWSKLNLKESVADTMRAVGIENWFQWRQRLFEQMFKEPYRGTAEQNIKLREKIKDYSAEDIIDMMKQWYTMTM